MTGCLWISTAEHEDRLADGQFVIRDLVFDPPGASACGGPNAVLTAVVDVGEERAGERFLVTWSVDGDEPVDAGALVAEDGQVAFDLEVDDWAARPGCASGCDLPLVVTLDRLGVEVTVDGVVQLVPSLVPELLDVELADPSGVRVPLVDADANGDGAYDVSAWPNLYFNLRDRHFGLGLGGRASLWYCPGDATPDTAPGSCVFTPVEALPEVVEGEQVFVATTAFLGERVCAPGGIDPNWHPFARIEGHSCGGPYTFDLAPEAVVFVLDDCDHDGVPAGPDCNDLDAGQNPNAYEVCDDLDNNCDGVTLVQSATLIRPSVPPVNFDSVQAAIDAASEVDEVVLCSGTYPGPFHVARDLTLSGGSQTAAEVVLTGDGGDGPVLAVTGGAAPSLVVRGLTVTGGAGADTGGGIDARLAGILTLEDCDIHDNDAQRGGGLAVAPITTLRRTTIRENSASKGGGMAIDAGCVVQLEGSTIATNGATEGAGIHVDTITDLDTGESLRATLTLDAASTVTGNLATYNGGGLYAVGDFDLVGGTFVGNDGPGGGGGVMLEALLPTLVVPSTWNVRDVTVTGNTSYYGGGFGAFGTTGSTLTMSASTVESNVASDVGGGLLLVAGSPQQFLAELTDVVVEYNDAVSGGGLTANYATVVVNGGHVKWNTADDGAGVYASAGVLTLGATTPTDIEFNEARNNAGGLLADFGSVLTHTSGRLSNNTSISGGAVGAIDAAVILGGSVESNVDVVGAPGLMLRGSSSVRLLGGAVMSGNGGSRVYDAAEVEACTGAVVDDAIGQGVDPDCFTITVSGYTDGCGC